MGASAPASCGPAPAAVLYWHQYAQEAKLKAKSEIGLLARVAHHNHTAKFIDYTLAPDAEAGGRIHRSDHRTPSGRFVATELPFTVEFTRRPAL